MLVMWYHANRSASEVAADSNLRVSAEAAVSMCVHNGGVVQTSEVTTATCVLTTTTSAWHHGNYEYPTIPQMDCHIKKVIFIKKFTFLSYFGIWSASYQQCFSFGKEHLASCQGIIWVNRTLTGMIKKYKHYEKAYWLMVKQVLDSLF